MDDSKTPLLFLSHRLPYPLNNSDKIRSWHLLKHLAKTHRIFLGAFVDDEQDWQYVDHVRDICEGSYFVRLNQTKARVKSVRALLSKEPLTLPYYACPDLKNWVEHVVKRNDIKKSMVYSSVMAQYVMDDHLPLEQLIIDFVDVDSHKLKQSASRKVWPVSSVFQREAEKLLAYDKRVAEKFDRNYFVSEPEAELFKGLAPEMSDKIDCYCNGIDGGYFCPEESFENPYPESKNILPIVFTGAMDDQRNIEAVKFFAKKVLPNVRKQHPTAQFVIVGCRPSDDVKELERSPGVTVTGSVKDVRPYIKHSALAVAPMRTAHGVQNKVLEAMAMQKPVVVSPQGLEGIEAIEGKEVLVAKGSEQFAQKIISVLDCIKGAQGVYCIEDAVLSGVAARQRILSDFNWDRNLEQIDTWLLANAEQKSGLRLVGKSIQESA